MVKRSSAEVGCQEKRQRPELEQYMSTNTTYYNHPINEKGANAFNSNKRERPFELLQDRIVQQKPSKVAKTVIHWFRNDLRISDNTAFTKAIEQLQEIRIREGSDCNIMAIFTPNEHDWIAHLESNWRLNFMYRALTSLQSELLELSIPLYVLEFKPDKPILLRSKKFAAWLKKKCLELSGGEPVQVTANAEYLVDELQRDINVYHVTDEYFDLNIYHDTCVVEPYPLRTQQGSQYTVFAPWYKKWCTYLMERKPKDDLVHISSVEKKKYNRDTPHQKIGYKLPIGFALNVNCPLSKILDASEDAGMSRLQEFLGNSIKKYDQKDLLPDERSSHLSAFLSVGLISARTVVNSAFSLLGGNLVGKSPKDMSPAEEFIREVAWRDFYKHAFCYWPYLSMDIPFNLGSVGIKWLNDKSHFEKWCYGKTGVPIVDAIMRKLLFEGYINNRARMITASFLSKNLLIDWRWGEKWFRKHLIDCDLASNIGGWGFCSSTGIDAQPYFRIFNMERQSKTYDPSGNFIRKWVPELKNVENVHATQQHVESYPDPIVDSKQSRQRALNAYKDGLY
ncbi:hypothetical protein BZL39_J00220 [Zygosaccharomyces parabailii]|nr:hypothetical protein BZL39_J00220 [Zygosaccharomyces parabailii]CDH16353.1 related to Deoxyribodipyrimidine photo-lyase,mitochondrial [Zygosaccharomyces bailii ISA1307]